MPSVDTLGSNLNVSILQHQQISETHTNKKKQNSW